MWLCHRRNALSDIKKKKKSLVHVSSKQPNCALLDCKSFCSAWQIPKKSDWNWFLIYLVISSPSHACNFCFDPVYCSPLYININRPQTPSLVGGFSSRFFSLSVEMNFLLRHAKFASRSHSHSASVHWTQHVKSTLRKQQGRLKSFRSIFQLLIFLNQWENKQWWIRKLDEIKGTVWFSLGFAAREDTPVCSWNCTADPAELNMKGQLEKLRYMCLQRHCLENSDQL